MFEYSNWSVLTVNFVVVLSLALSGVALCSVLHLVNAKWRFEVRNLSAALFALFPLAFVLLIILLANGEHTFPWWSHADPKGAHMPGWYHPSWLIAREVVGMLFMIGLYWEFIQRQAVSGRSPEDAARFHSIATWIPFFFVLYSTMIAWDFEMTLVPHWHSAIYGMWISVLNNGNKLVRPVPNYIYNYLAQMLFAFTLLWIYTFDAQYLTIWYGNLPDETDRLWAMQNGDYTFIWWSTLALKFVIPFVTFCFPGPRHNVSAIKAVATCIIVGTLFERYVWIGGINGTGAYPIFATMVVSGIVAAVGFLLVRMQMRRMQLIKG